MLLMLDNVMPFLHAFYRKSTATKSATPNCFFLKSMTTRRIEPKSGAEVYVGANGHVCIQQSQPDGEVIIILHRDEVPELIEFLQGTYQEALDYVPDPEDENNDT